MFLIMFSYKGVQLYVHVIDEDSENGKPDEQVDFFLINHTLASCRRVHTETFVTMDLNITVLCVENFQEPDCTQCVTGFTEVDDCVGVSGRGQCVDGVDSLKVLPYEAGKGYDTSPHQRC